MKIRQPISPDSQVLLDAARQLRSAARRIEQAADLKLDGETAQRWMREAEANMNAAMTRVQNYLLSQSVASAMANIDKAKGR